jgi:hypothetical protein
LNHTDTDVIVKGVQQAPWRDRKMVQVFMKEQEEELFRLRCSGLELDQRISVDLAAEELRMICNALNEVCNGLELQDEFETRIGSSLNSARSPLARLGAIAQR